MTPYTVRFLMIAVLTSIGAHRVHASDVIEVFTEPYRSIEVAAAEQGILNKIDVEQGDFVSVGEQVATLNREVLLAAMEIAQMRANMEAPMRRATADVRQKERRYQKILALHGKGHASEEELDSARTLLEIAQADLLDAQEKQKLAFLQMKEIQAQLRRRSISSPVNGQVVKLHKDAGEYVASLEPVVATIVQLDKLRVKFYVDTSAAYNMQRGHQVPIVFRDTNQKTMGTIEFVSPTTDADSSTVRVEVVIDNQQNTFRSGVAVRLVPGAQAQRKTQQQVR